MTRIILTTGGTGGHVFPALAVAEALKGHQCLFVGSVHGPEQRWAAEAGLEFKGLAVRGFMGKGLKAVLALGAMLRAVVQAVGILRRFRPDVVAGFGGYASFAPLAAARLLGIPVVVHEQNAFPGLSNRILGKLADKVCVSLENDTLRQAFAADKLVYTGNPVRQSIVRAMQHTAGAEHLDGKRLLVMGGSQGARAINSLVLGGLQRLKEAGVELWHQSGQADYDRVKAGYTAFMQDTSRVQPFIDRMDEAYAWADVVLCRAGASTVAELAIAGKAAVFIPFPFATHNHQMFNARAVEKAGAALVMDETILGTQDAVGALIALLHDTHTVETMSKAAKALARPNAAEAVAREILSIGKRHAN